MIHGQMSINAWGVVVRGEGKKVGPAGVEGRPWGGYIRADEEGDDGIRDTGETNAERETWIAAVVRKKRKRRGREEKEEVDERATKTERRAGRRPEEALGKLN